ncbi:MAG: hypothetical protein A3E01_03890 [Gammaproteobacteria bacterium RIFCSPHIGHO2_12_FULL_63_22]|nr:MAG: hypothetical protein A3E01_03890 [Gammaproteobacteria bacterium RIFCSPHIGHO2_12_FULL_63_22]
MTPDATPDGPAPSPTAPAYRFGRFELHPARRELLLDGQPVELQPKVFELIAYLVDNRDRAVEKNELLDAVWPRQVVTDAALSRCVMKARRALLDDVADSKMILTVHGRGFRFLAPVVLIADEPAPVAAPGPAPATAPISAGEIPARRSTDVAPAAAPSTKAMANHAAPSPRIAPWASLRRWFFPLLATTVLVLAVFGAWRWQQASVPTITGPVRVAVMPVVNRTGDARYDWARLGLMNGANEILRARGASVIDSRALVELEAGLSSLDAEARVGRVRSALGATHVVQGELDSSGGKLQIAFALSGPNGRTQHRTVLAEQLPALAQALAADLSIQLGLAGNIGANLDDQFANEAYLRGLGLRLQGDSKAALPYFRQAAAQAPGNPWPRLQMANAQQELGDSKQAKAVLEPLLSEADASGDARLRKSVRSSLATVYSQSGDDARAEKLLLEALPLAEAEPAPDAVVPVLSRLGILATYRRDFKAAHDYLDRAVAAQVRAGLPKPSGEIQNSLAQLALREGDLVNAGVHLEAALAQFKLVGNRRNEATALSGLSNLRRRQGRFEEARDLVARARDVHRQIGYRRGEASALMGLGIAEAELGRITIAIDDIRDARFIAEEIGERALTGSAHSMLGQLFMDVGDLRRSRRHLEVSLANAEALGDASRARRQRYQLARLAALEGDAQKSRQSCQELLAGLDDSADRDLRVKVLRHLAGLSMAAGDTARAQDELAQAQAAVEAMDDARLKAQVQLSQAELALLLRDPVRAGERLDAAEPELGRESDFLVAKARLREASGESREALALEQAAKLAAGERWRPEDETRLQARLAAAH